MALRCASQVTFFGGSDASRKRLETELKQRFAEPRKISVFSKRFHQHQKERDQEQSISWFFFLPTLKGRPPRR